MRLLFASVIFLLLFAACQQPAASTETSGAANEVAIQGAKIGYIDTDSVLAGYTYLSGQTEILRKREADATASLERKQRTLQDQVASFQRRAQAGNMTPKAIENETALLTRKDQELQEEYQRLSQEFQGETIRLQNELGNVLERVVKEVQAEEGYDYILSYGSGSPVLGINEKYNLTSKVLERMNASDSPAADTSAAN